jgi:hypothetical protein
VTTPELLRYTRRHFRQNQNGGEALRNEPYFPVLGEINPAQFRNLVARRLVREGDFDTAKEFFSPKLRQPLSDYANALAKSRNLSKSKSERARALFHAAWIARHQGMELMGMEGSPDNAETSGAFRKEDLAMARLKGAWPEIDDFISGDGENPLNFPLPVTAGEKRRLQATQLPYERRFHYRLVAADLAWKAAKLLPDNKDETADVLNTAGNWIKLRHPKQSERFAFALERRCPNTAVGKIMKDQGRFVEADGPWSSEERRLNPPAQKPAFEPDGWVADFGGRPEYRGGFWPEAAE